MGRTYLTGGASLQSDPAGELGKIPINRMLGLSLGILEVAEKVCPMFGRLLVCLLLILGGMNLWFLSSTRNTSLVFGVVASLQRPVLLWTHFCLNSFCWGEGVEQPSVVKAGKGWGNSQDNWVSNCLLYKLPKSSCFCFFFTLKLGYTYPYTVLTA